MIIVTPWQVHRTRCHNYLTCWWSTCFDNITPGWSHWGLNLCFRKFICDELRDGLTRCWYICDERYKCANPVVSFRWPNWHWICLLKHQVKLSMQFTTRYTRSYVIGFTKIGNIITPIHCVVTINSTPMNHTTLGPIVVVVWTPIQTHKLCVSLLLSGCKMFSRDVSHLMKQVLGELHSLYRICRYPLHCLVFINMRPFTWLISWIVIIGHGSWSMTTFVIMSWSDFEWLWEQPLHCQLFDISTTWGYKLTKPSMCYPRALN